MKQFLLTFAGVFAALLLFFVFIPLALIVTVLGAGPAPTPPNAVLALDLRGGLTDQPPTDPFSTLTGASLSVSELVLKLRAAAGDPKVKALIVRLPEGGMDPASADELAQAFRRLRAEGKRVYVHSQGLYASGMITSTYMLGASADEFWMQSGAPFEVTGLATEEVFLARLFDRLGIEAQFEQRESYKNAVNTYLYSDFTPAHREAQLGWMNAVFDAALSSISADRRSTAEAVRAALVAGPYDAAGALEQGLIDKLGQAEDLQEAALDAAGPNGRLVDISHYHAPPGRGSTREALALINVEGALVTGPGGAGLLGGTAVGSDTIAAAIHEAIDDDQVKAIVMRVSSPGGSDTASEQIAAAMRAARAAGKPVVVSMGAYAASGGYSISAEADRIIAQPTTLTGSIGVYGGKISAGEAAARYGVDLAQLTVGGDYAGIGALGEPMSPAQAAAYAAQIDRVYANFLTIVARGRNIPPDRVRQIAGGRVWTGVQAMRLGLVDELGGLTEAIEAAKALGGLEGRVPLKSLPRPVSPRDALEQLLGASAGEVRTMAAVGRLLDDRRVRAALEPIIASRGESRVLAPDFTP